VVLTRRLNFGFEESNRFVAEKADGAASEPWQLWPRNKLMPRHKLTQLLERIASRTESFLNPVPHNTDVAPEALNNYSWLESDERKAAGRVIFFCCLEKEAVSAVA